MNGPNRIGARIAVAAVAVACATPAFADSPTLPRTAAVPGGGPTLSAGVQALMQLEQDGAFKQVGRR